MTKSSDYPSPDQRQWALATAAILTGYNRGRYDILGGTEISPKYVTQWKGTLQEWWGVENREDLLATLEWIERGGHRKNFDKLAALTPSEWSALLAQDPTNLEIRYKKIIVARAAQELKGKSLLGWDYARFVSLCGWGYQAGYLSEDEAWQRIMPVAKMLQKTFDSWEDLGENYLIGRAFWSSQQYLATGREMYLIRKTLLNDPESPYNTTPWNLNLD